MFCLRENVAENLLVCHVKETVAKTCRWRRFTAVDGRLATCPWPWRRPRDYETSRDVGEVGTFRWNYGVNSAGHIHVEAMSGRQYVDLVDALLTPAGVDVVPRRIESHVMSAVG